MASAREKSDERALREALEQAQARVKALEAERRSAQPSAAEQRTIEQLRTELAVLRRTQADAVARETAALRVKLKALQERGSGRRAATPRASAPRKASSKEVALGEELEQEKGSHAVTRAALETAKAQLHHARAQIVELEHRLHSSSRGLGWLARAMARVLRNEPEDVAELRAIIVTLRSRIIDLEAGTEALLRR